MWPLWCCAVLVTLGLGFGAKLAFDYFSDEFRISWIEFAVVAAILSLLIIPITVKVGLDLAKASKLTYHEFWGGFETAAVKTPVPCTRDGHCSDTYRCDPYTVTTVVMNADGKGSHLETHTEYHSCPVATVENYYAIRTTLGNYDLGYTFDKPAVAWRSGESFDGTFQGDPPIWLAAKDRLDRGDPGPVTADKTYQNYILASTRTILHRFSDAVAKYRTAGLLVDPVANLKKPIHDYYYADKMQFVGVPNDDETWQFALAQFNAALGSDLQGDLHVVAINAARVDNPDEYAGATNAWWQDKHLAKRALSKNGIGLVLGVTDGRVAWARAFTGMPVGNDGLNLDLQTALTGAKFTPKLFGHPTATIVGKKATVKLSGSALENAMWGPHKFQRVCMVCKTKGDHGTGYSYLGREVQPSFGQRAWIVIVAILLALFLWAVALFVQVGEGARRARSAW